ncbi:hypothetical protein Patl1_35347 [Pistacia atlantica]|nr:hypothetical protein Patl1_35347 [Pistacia atlantica]
MNSFISGHRCDSNYIILILFDSLSYLISQVQEGSNTWSKINQDHMNLEDYQPVDPTPRSSAAITSGPIEHGTPVMPYIPKLTPPNSPQPDGSPSLPPPA